MKSAFFFFQEHYNTKRFKGGKLLKGSPFLFRLKAVGRLKLSFEILLYSWWWAMNRIEAEPLALLCALLSPAHLQTQVVLHLKEGREGNVEF